MIEEILKTLEDNGYTCYLIGGYVRDKLLGIESNDVDITTSATPEEVSKIFNLDSKPSFGCLKFPSDKYNIEITTYRKEANYEKRHPKALEFTSDILEDLKRRDFTINAICMDSRGNIFDPLGGKNDLDKRLIRVIGEVDVKFREDPLRMLRALRFSVTHSFKIEPKAKKFIEANGDLIRSLSYERKKRELDLIFNSENSENGVKMLESLNILEALELKPKTEFVKNDLLGSWAEFDFPKDYPFKKSERTIIENISSIVEKSKIDEWTLLEYGLSINLCAGKILGITQNTIIKKYEAMPIKNERDLDFDGRDLREILGIEGKMIEEAKKDLLKEVLSGNLPNRCIDIRKYVIEKWK